MNWLREILDAHDLDYFSFLAGSVWATIFCVVSWCIILTAVSVADKSRRTRTRIRNLTRR